MAKKAAAKSKTSAPKSQKRGGAAKKKAPAKKAPAKKAPAKKAPAKKAPANGRSKRLRRGKKVIIRTKAALLEGGARVRIADPDYSSTDCYTGEEYVLSSGDDFDAGYFIMLPAPSDYPDPINCEFVVGEPESNPQNPLDPEVPDGSEWFEYSATVPDDTTPPTEPYDTLEVNMDYIDEFIEYYEPDPCDSYRMSNDHGSFGIMG